MVCLSRKKHYPQARHHNVVSLDIVDKVTWCEKGNTVLALLENAKDQSGPL